DFCTLEFRKDRAYHAARQAILQIEDVFEIAIELVRPDVRVRRRINQLAGHTNPFSRLAYAAFQHIASAKLTADLLDVDGLSFVGETRISRDYEQQFRARQSRDDILDHAVGEIFLFRIVA